MEEKTYLFCPRTTMKKRDSGYWIDQDIVPQLKIRATSRAAAVKKFVEKVNEETGVVISQHALEHKTPCYIDTTDGDMKQVGYVFTGSYEFYDDNLRDTVLKYVEIWTTIYVLTSAF